MKRLSAALLLALLLAGGCSEPDRKAQLKATIRTMADALESYRADTFLAHVAEDFVGESGAWNRRRVKRFVLGHALRKQPVSIDVNDMRLTLYDGRAEAVVTATVAGEGRWWPTAGHTFRFDTGWRLADGKWRIIRANWERRD